MKSDYWIKLYHEILDDSKMGTLPDRLWRRCIEMFLLAGRFGGMKKDGILPSTNELAWVLRVEADELELDLKQLQSAGILEPIAGGWLVVHFAERQAAVPADERGKQFRQKHSGKPANIPYNVTVTQSERYSNDTFVESESESQTEEEEGRNAPAASATPAKIPATDQTIERIWEQVTGTPTFYGTTKADDMRRIEAVFNRNEWDLPRTVKELKGYYDAWINSYSPKTSRKYSKMNTGWLDWALAGEVNGNGGNNNGHRTLTPEERIKIEFAKIERGMK